MINKIEDIIAEEGAFVGSVGGCSMYPMIRERVDNVLIVPVSGRLKKYDVALYTVGEKHVLHRVVKVLDDSYVMCGDNCVDLERGITDAQIIGRLDRVWRGEKEKSLDTLGYRLYSRYKVLEFWPRRIIKGLRKKVATAVKQLFGKK